MATTYATHAAALNTAKASGPRVGTLRGTDALADLVVITSTYTLSGSEAANDIIEITAPVPEALVPVPSLSCVGVESDPGTSFIIDIGTSADADAYADGIDLSSVGKVDFGVLPVTTLPDSGKILATVKTATTLTADAVITFYLVCRSVS